MKKALHLATNIGYNYDYRPIKIIKDKLTY